MSVDIHLWNGQEAFAFGDSPALADELGALVVAGRKTATCWAAVQGNPTHVGKRLVMLDGQGRGWAVLETVELTLRRFDEVDAAYARDEGEGDLSLESWRAGHRDYFTREVTFAPDMPLWCERFKVVKILDRETGR
ncbi:MAG: ASCH domain-containing protein [Caulobacteraceae bacterium]